MHPLDDVQGIQSIELGGASCVRSSAPTAMAVGRLAPPVIRER
jgi:hypothetical protein